MATPATPTSPPHTRHDHPGGWRVRPATVADLDAIVVVAQEADPAALVHDPRLHPDWAARDRGRFEAAIRDGDTLAVVAETDDGQIIGVLTAHAGRTSDTGPRIQAAAVGIDLFHIAGPYQHHGVHDALYQRFHTWAADEHAGTPLMSGCYPTDPARKTVLRAHGWETHAEFLVRRPPHHTVPTA